MLEENKQGLQSSLYFYVKVIMIIMLYSRHFSHYRVPNHWLVHGHMKSNNETVSCQMP